MSTPSQKLENSNTSTTSELKASSTKSGTMLTLLQEIENYDAHAASVLKKEDFQTDFEIQTLTREDLEELFPGKDKREMRNLICEIIKRQKQTQSLQEEPEGVTKPESLKDVVIAVCLHWIEDTKKQLDEKEADIKRPEDSDKSLRSKTDAHFQTDSVIQTFTREGLQKLFPGPNNFKLRKTIFEILHNRATYLLLGESGDFTQQDPVKDYPIRKQNMKDQLDKMQAVLEKGYVSETKAPMTTKKENFSIRQFYLDHFQKPPVKYKMVVCGETFGAHHQLLDKIQTPDLNLIKGKDEESCITIVFCPVVSRSGTDAEAAIKKVPGDGPVLLVLMHYSQEPKYVSSSKVLSGYSNVLLEVNIFFHDKKKGLLKCEQNQNAVTELKKELKKYSKTQSSGSYKKNQSNSWFSS